MSRRLPTKPNKNQSLIIKATEDFFGEARPEEKKSIVKIALWIMGRKARNVLSEEEKEAVKLIQNNLADPVYSANLKLKADL